jgi:hypothetical protein
MIRMRVYLQGEAPRIGDGWRNVSVIIGRKYVRIATLAGRAKLTMDQWKAIERGGARELCARPKFRRGHMKVKGRRSWK